MSQKIKEFITIFTIVVAFIIIPINLNTSFAETQEDLMFKQPATEFNVELAKYALTLSTAAYGSTTENIELLLTNYEYTNDAVYDAASYEKSSQMGTNLVAYSFAHKKIKCDNKDYNLIAVVIRGTSSDNEWVSNFNINDSGYSPAVHEGFSKAEKSLLSHLNSYIESLNIEKSNTKLLITGHSRGAAVANLLAADLTRNGKLAFKSNIYGYTFATPNVAKLSSNHYFNIFNAVNPVDVVTEIPLSKWGYGKYGVNYTIPETSNLNPKDLAATEQLLTQLIAMAPTVKDFYNAKLSFTLLQGDLIPTETSNAHNPEVYMKGLKAVNPEKLSKDIFRLQLKLIPDDVYA